MFHADKTIAMCFLMAGLVANGCQRGPELGEVRSQVLLDNKPLDSGSVRFVPISGKGTTAGTTVVNGAFQTQLPVNNYRVEITAIQSGRKAKNRYVDEGIVDIELIPKKYNVNSELTLDVKPGTNERVFDLSSR